MADRQAAIGPISHRLSEPPGIWVFIAADCAGFAIFFLVFMSERLKQQALYDASARLLDLRLGVLNTLILITSGALVALAMTAVEVGRHALARRRLLAGLLVGSGFAVAKITEYALKVAAGITPATNPFFTFYFILTGMHFLHYLIGISVLVAMIAGLRGRRDNDGMPAPPWLEAAALYWHMVDLLWLFLFPMLYLLPAR